jgi:hypothetical protein
MPRVYVEEPRGDSRTEAVDLYHHFDEEELRSAYLACTPKLGCDGCPIRFLDCSVVFGRPSRNSDSGGEPAAGRPQ